MQITCTINAKHYTFECEPHERALDLIRGLGLLAAKEGCGEGECGACSVFYNGKLVNACLLPAVQMQGADIMTLEGLLEETEAIRERFAEEDAVQCGFCTPGFVLRAYDYINSGGIKDEDALKKALDGNLCRCTGYQKIIRAILKSMA